jgi:hypothetical protein
MYPHTRNSIVVPDKRIRVSISVSLTPQGGYCGMTAQSQNSGTKTGDRRYATAREKHVRGKE